ncbi:hypothetical protein [Phaeobacter sp. J2-8]|uniref:hypothetical protein n=1 Tax=Phaeobacter sp. J2-8 TaxID=2931394 RepID=UPI001FD31905|nr:hypothetical protein [Phaeobacter sp. J2-8]MCJ7874784.1 hypothetical protein [Phaeobacter sp. J2-8]
MKTVTRARAVGVGLATILLVSCTDTAQVSQKGFAAQYSTARTALEKGNYDLAGRVYARMLPQAGPLSDRIQLEYAHAMLRSGEFQRASQMAGVIADRSNGSDRAAALSVKGTADHEMALILLREGDQINSMARLKAAQQSLQEVLNKHPDFDPLGALAGRQASIAVQLKTLR